MKTLPIWFVIMLFGLFSVNSLCTCIIAALAGAGSWNKLDGTTQFIIIISILGNWSGMVISFASRSVEKYLAGKIPIPNGDVPSLPTIETTTYHEKITTATK